MVNTHFSFARNIILAENTPLRSSQQVQSGKTLYVISRNSIHMNYSTEKCNIPNCEETHYRDFLCKKHYKMYVVDEKSSSIMERLYRINTNQKKLSDWFVLIINNLIHYTANISVYYVEHFPLETLFIYHFKNVDIGKNKHYNKLDFIKDFDDKNNHRIGLLKSHLKTQDSKDKIVEFTKKTF